MERFVCVHGHFYQPPRENPRTGEIDRQPSAAPFHDWNERITKECYRPLAGLGAYERMSFNFGPTLLSWMEGKAPDVYRAVLDSDRRSAARFSGHGSAIAQAYNHMILPLANHRDRMTQVAWGIRDFRHRFGRRPEGMWLPETAADLESLEILAGQGIGFTVLAPHQARATRPLGSERWRPSEAGKLDTTRPYLQQLSSGRKIYLFFYDGAISRGIAFEGLDSDGTRLAARLERGFRPQGKGAQLAHTAADGETYGHHHEGADRVLADALGRIEEKGAVRLTNYAEFLHNHPVTHEAQVREKSSWSCTHGIDRWWSDCGCNSGGHPGWNQRWRTPLRNALDWLRDTLAPLFEREAGRLLKDPWAARDRAIELELDRSPECRERFFAEEERKPLTPEGKQRALELLDLQRQTLLMYTSCGWFFDDIGGIEAGQILRYAARAVDLGQGLFGRELGSHFKGILAGAVSNNPAQGSGATIYEKVSR